MTQAAFALPLDPDELVDVSLRIRLMARLRENSQLATQVLREQPGFQELAKGPWALFQAIADHWQSNDEARPCMATLARVTGYKVRRLQDFSDLLEKGGIVAVRRERRAKGHDRLYYSPGFVTLRGLQTFDAKYPSVTLEHMIASAVRRTLAELFGVPATSLRKGAVADEGGNPPATTDAETLPTSSPPPAILADTPPATIATERRGFNKEPSSCVSTPNGEPDRQEETVDCTKREGESGEGAKVESAAPPPAPERPVTPPATLETQGAVTDDDRELAKVILGERIKRKHPGRSAPRLFSVSELTPVAFCVAALEGDRESKLEALRDSLAGAFQVSKGPPAIDFIWGNIDRFYEHAERGKQAREAEQKEREKAEKKRIARERAKLNPPPPPARGSDRVGGSLAIFHRNTPAFSTFFVVRRRSAPLSR